MTKLLHWVDIKVANQNYCNRMYKNVIHNTQLCAYDNTTVKGHCDVNISTINLITNLLITYSYTFRLRVFIHLQ